MPVLYFAPDGPQSRLRRRASLTFGELRGMFGAYEVRYVSQHWPHYELAAESRAPARVVIEVSERDGAAQQYDRPGFYLLVDLAPAKVDELLKYRESYARRLDDADRWGFAHTHVQRRGRAR